MGRPHSTVPMLGQHIRNIAVQGKPDGRSDIYDSFPALKKALGLRFTLTPVLLGLYGRGP